MFAAIRRASSNLIVIKSLVAQLCSNVAMRLSLFILGIFAALGCIASSALAQYVSRSDRSISVHHRQHVRVSSDPSGTPPPRDPRSWVGDPAGRPYVYVPGMASGGGGF